MRAAVALPVPGRIKAFAKRRLPPRLRRTVRRWWEDVRDWIDVFVFGLGFTIRREARPRTVLHFGFAPGDDLLCTAVLRELRRRGRGPLLMVSDHLQLFRDNPDAAYVRPLWKRYAPYDSTVRICRRFARLYGAEFVQPEYAPPLDTDRSRPPARHIIAEMCARANVTGAVSIRPYLHLTEAERAASAWADGRIVIQSSGLQARHPMGNKQWYPDRFQGVVDTLCGDVEFVQLGGATDPRLDHAVDLRGHTSIRETAAILSQARLFIGTVGFLMHLARAVDCPSTIIYGGREAPWQTGYSCNLNLYSAVPCAPCWRWNTCDFDRKCMSDISVADVVAAVRQMLERPRSPLAVEAVDISQSATQRVNAPL